VLPPPQVCPPAQIPQLMMPPQPSPTEPQVAFACWQVRGTHVLLPHTPGDPPPPHMSPGLVQMPHWRRPPQPSPSGPQLAPASAASARNAARVSALSGDAATAARLRRYAIAALYEAAAAIADGSAGHADLLAGARRANRSAALAGGSATTAGLRRCAIAALDGAAAASPMGPQVAPTCLHVCGVQCGGGGGWSG